MPGQTTRIVCISDTHNQHEQLRLPPAHVLIHAGDLLTESGLRHVTDGTASASGVALVRKFAQWFARQPHPHKVLVPGNHDQVLEALGEQAVNELFAAECKPGSFVYLLNQTASLPGSLKVYGSPFGRWGGHNRAFYGENSYRSIERETHVVVTHYPAVLPGETAQREEEPLVRAMERANALVHVGGHCHWAYGKYLTSTKVPCYVASVCDHRWAFGDTLQGTRGDEEGDLFRGGYNVSYDPVVFDVPVPPPSPSAVWSRHV